MVYSAPNRCKKIFILYTYIREPKSRWSHWETDQVCTLRNKLFILVPARVLCTMDISGSSRTVHKFVQVVMYRTLAK